jgi:hypothetical protein
MYPLPNSTPVMLVKLIIRINHAESESMRMAIGPVIGEPCNRISVGKPPSAFHAGIRETAAFEITAMTAAILFNFGLTKGIVTTETARTTNEKYMKGIEQKNKLGIGN